MADKSLERRKSARVKTSKALSVTCNSSEDLTDFGRKRANTVVRKRTLKELVEQAECRIKELKETQQGVTSEGISVKGERQALLETIDREFDLLHKMLDRKKSYMIQALKRTMGDYVSDLDSFSHKFEEEMAELDRAVSKARNQDTAGICVLDLEDRMLQIKAELEETMDSSRDESLDAAITKSKRPQIQFQQQFDRFRELINNIGWLEQKVELTVRAAIDSPVQIEKTKETLAFLPLDVAVNPDGAVYVLDGSRDAGFVHFFINGKRLNLINLTKELKIKRPPDSMCITNSSIYVSFPDVDLVAAIPKRVGELGIRFITPQSIAHLPVGIKSPHGLASCDGNNVLIADTGNNRVVVLACFKQQVVQVLSGTPHAPLCSPRSVAGTDEGLVVVLHSGACSVHIYTLPSGELKWRTCTFEIGTSVNPSESWVPYRVAISKIPGGESHEVLMSACYQGEQCLLRYNLKPNWLCRQGKTGNKFGQFKDIKGIAFNPHDETILVCDQGNERIQVFEN